MSNKYDILAEFEKEIGRQEDLLFGIALFFEGLALLHDGQEAAIDTHRQQFRNVIQLGKATAERARNLLKDVRRDPSKLPQVEQFAFHPGEGYPEPEVLVARAHMMISTYQDLFPDRPRDQPLGADETLQLLEAASKKMP